MIKYLLMAILLICSNVYADNMICNDFECLVQNSNEQYHQDYKHWWVIYQGTAELAKKCHSSGDVITFLKLWSGQVDGEMAQAFYEDTEHIISNHTPCFFSALSMSQSTVQMDFFSKWCPITGLNIGEILEGYLVEKLEDDLALQFLKRLDSKRCFS